MLSLSAEQHGNVMEQAAKVSEEEKKENREEKLVRSLYFLRLRITFPILQRFKVWSPYRLKMGTSS